MQRGGRKYLLDLATAYGGRRRLGPDVKPHLFEHVYLPCALPVVSFSHHMLTCSGGHGPCMKSSNSDPWYVHSDRIIFSHGFSTGISGPLGPSSATLLMTAQSG